MTVAELVAASRARQGLPATVEDPATIRRLARLVLATTSKATPASDLPDVARGDDGGSRRFPPAA